MIGKLFSLCYLRLLSFPVFPQSALFVFNKLNILRLPVVREKQKKTRVSTWQGRSGRLKTKWEPRQEKERKLGLPVAGWLWSTLLHIYAGSSYCTDRMSLFMPSQPSWCSIVALMSLTMTSSYCFGVSNPSVVLLLFFQTRATQLLCSFQWMASLEEWMAYGECFHLLPSTVF